MNQPKIWKPAQGNGGKFKSIGKRLGIGGSIVLGVVLILFMISYLVLIRPVLALRGDVAAIQKHTAAAQVALKERDLVAFTDNLDKVESDLKDLRKTRDNKLGWTKSFPKLKIYYSDSEYFIQAGLHAVEAGRKFAVIVEPFSDALGLKTGKIVEATESEPLIEDTEASESGLMEAFSAWISAMPLVAENSDPIIDELSKMGAVLSKVDAANYPEEFQGFPLKQTILSSQNTLTKLNDYAPDIKRALVLFPDLLGVGGVEKRYMIIMQNDKEIRATGGFWTYLATFKVNNGLLSSDFSSYNSYYVDTVLDAIDAYHTFPKVPPTYEKHLKVERMFARDANVSPDLPTSVDQFMYFWDLAKPLNPAQFKDIDGAIVIDTKVLEELLEITGPATVNGFTYTKDNVVLELEKLASLALAEQVNRKKVLGDLMEEMLINVFESDKNLWPKLVDKGVDLLLRKHVAAVVFDPEAQALLDKHNFSGRIVDPVEGDYVFVNQTNLGGDKTNWFVNKTVDHKMVQEGDKIKRTVTINYTYTQHVEEYAPFVKRFRDWVRVYTPKDSTLIKLTGSEDPAGEGEERNKKYFHGFITLGPGESKSMTFEYYVPNSVIQNGVYNLYIQKQLAIDTEKHTVTVDGETKEVILNKLDGKYSKKLK